MNTKIGRFLIFIMKENTRKIFAFIVYVYFIGIFMKIDLPLVLKIISFIVLMFIAVFGGTTYMVEWRIKMYEKSRGGLGKYIIIDEIEKIGNEIFMFMPIFLISCCVTSFIMIGEPANETSVYEMFYEAPIFNAIIIIIIGPIIEEFIFRFLSYRFIKNKILYVIVSTVIFAGMHVLNDPNPFYYIWFYMMRPLYYGYRYHKTKDILVPISMHSLNNLFAVLLFVLS